jgi:hypothetical protein
MSKEQLLQQSQRLMVAPQTNMLKYKSAKKRYDNKMPNHNNYKNNLCSIVVEKEK